MAEFDAQRDAIIANVAAMTEGFDKITADILRLRDQIAAGKPITLEDMNMLVNITTAAKDRVVDIDGMTPE